MDARRILVLQPLHPLHARGFRVHSCLAGVNNRNSTSHHSPHLCVSATQNTYRVPHNVDRSIPYSSA